MYILPVFYNLVIANYLWRSNTAGNTPKKSAVSCLRERLLAKLEKRKKALAGKRKRVYYFLTMISLVSPEGSATPQKETVRLFLKDDGVFPNNAKVPLVLHRQVASTAGGSATARAMETILEENGWEPQWHGSLYNVHHYHATTHEAIGVLCGEATVQFGGPQGPEIRVRAGDAILIPAGVAHCLKTSTRFRVIGAYPPGCTPDMCTGAPGERPGTEDAIRQAPLPISPGNVLPSRRLFL